MTKSRLTRQELSWLLTQEAQHAAERLRAGVQVLRTQAPPPPAPEQASPPADPATHVDASLDALDDVMRMLSNLNQRAPQGGAAALRRGRIDVAALLVELAPEARVSIEPGSGTEVFGDEADFRRMLQILIGHGGGDGSTVVVRRDGEEVRVSVSLGPDTSPTAETERVWLSRMAIRYGGRHELEGGNEIVVFPAEEAAEASEREALRRELDEARRQGEAYARELAAIFERGEQVTSISTVPPGPGDTRHERFATLTKLAAGLASELRAVLGPLAREAGALRRPEITDEQLDTLRRRVAHAQEVVGTVGSVGDVMTDELVAETDLLLLGRAVAHEARAVAQRGEVAIEVGPDDACALARSGPKALAALARELVLYAVSASPRGTTVRVTLGTNEAGAARLVVDDAGAPLPASARRSFLTLETHAGAYGRPSALPIFMAAELATCLGARLELSDAPSGGLRVAVTFPKH